VREIGSQPDVRDAALGVPLPHDRHNAGSSEGTTMQRPADLVVEAAFAEHGASLVRYLSWLTHDRELAEDLAQEAFLRLACELDAGRRPDSVPAWLHRVGKNLATSQARRNQVAMRHEASLPRQSQPRSPEAIVLGSELATRVDALVGELSPTEQHVVFLAASGARGEEMAEAVGRSAAATRTMLCRARAKLRIGLLQAGYATA
jgi:RNA polymerase sigma-70 factor (ECF subfamily)